MRKRFKSFLFAFKGIADLFKNTPNAQIHLMFAIAVVVCGFIFDISKTEWMFCILSISLVLMAEGFNTALEYLTDLVSPDYHELAGKTKDVAAGAVFIMAIGAAIIGFLIFAPKGWNMLLEFIQ